MYLEEINLQYERQRSAWNKIVCEKIKHETRICLYDDMSTISEFQF